MEKCLLCLSMRKSFISINSLEWKELHVIPLIEKHLWPMEYNTESVICKKCWKELSGFHKFFLDIQKSHKVLVLKNLKCLNDKEVPKSGNNDITQHSNDVEQYIYENKESDPLTELEVVKLTDNNDKNQTKNIESVDVETNNYENVLENTHSDSESLDNNEITAELDPLTGLEVFKLTDDNDKNQTKNIESLEVETNNYENVLENIHSDSESLYNNEITTESDSKQTDDNDKNQQTNIESLEVESIHYNSESLENNEITTISDSLTEIEVVKPTNEIGKNQQKNLESLQAKENNCETNLENEWFENSENATKSKSNKYKFDETDKFIAQHFKINCCLCQMSMKKFAELHKHFEKHHEGNAYVVCCEKKFFTRWRLYDHLMLHKNPNYYKCSQCNGVLLNRRILKNHLKNHCESKNSRKLANKVDRYIAKHIKMQCLDVETNNYKSLLENTHSDSESLDNNEITAKLDPLTGLEVVKLTDDNDKNQKKNIETLEVETNNYENVLENTRSDSELLDNNEITAESDSKQTYDNDKNQQANTESLESLESLENNEIRTISDSLTEIEVIKPTNEIGKNQRKNIESLQAKENNCETNSENERFENRENSKELKNNKYKSDETDEFIAQHFQINCRLCQMPMKTFSEFRIHFEDYHEGNAYVVCCEKKFFKRWTLYDHLILHKNPNYYKCSQCNGVLQNRRSLKIHLKRHKAKHCESKNGRNLADKIDRYIAKHIKMQCCLCQTPINRFSDLCQHFEENHKARGYVICCNQKFFKRWMLHDHLILHKNPNYYKCSQCSEVLPNRMRLKHHLNTHKEKVPRTYNCEICGHTTKNLSAFKIHKTTHLSEEEKKIECSKCGKKFGIKYQLTKHIKVVHLKIHAKVCEICGISFCSIHALKYHMLKHEDKPAPTFDCDVCGLKLSSKSVLKRHKSTLHSDPKEYTCTICSKVSTNINSHKWHMNSAHLRRYDHKCSICDKAFTKACKLRDHMGTHTGTAVHTCPWCPKTFSSSGNFHAHRKNKHPEEWLEFMRKKYSGKLPPQRK